MTPQISVIIPVYNSAPTIERCIDSILKQDFTDFEVLLVNDGSADNSLEVMHQQALRDSRIVAIDKPHSGVSDTRNLALDKARGEYVCFIDADDTVESNYLSAMYAHRDCDMVICGYFVDEYDEEGMLFNSTEKIPSPINLSKIEGNKQSLKDLFMSGMVHFNWNKLFKRSIIENNRLRFVPIPVNEDFYFSLDYLNHANSICTISDCLYHWGRVRNHQSGVASMPENLLEIYTKSHQDIANFFEDLSAADEIMYYTYFYVVLKYIEAYERGKICTKEAMVKLKATMNDPHVIDAFHTRRNATKGECIMNFLLLHKLFRSFMMFRKLVR